MYFIHGIKTMLALTCLVQKLVHCVDCCDWSRNLCIVLIAVIGGLTLRLVNHDRLKAGVTSVRSNPYYRLSNNQQKSPHSSPPTQLQRLCLVFTRVVLCPVLDHGPPHIICVEIFVPLNHSFVPVPFWDASRSTHNTWQRDQRLP